jgi:hypothetical protein
MSKLDYLRRRLVDENRMVDQAVCAESEMVHRSLATHYARQALQEIRSSSEQPVSLIERKVG